MQSAASVNSMWCLNSWKAKMAPKGPTSWDSTRSTSIGRACSRPPRKPLGSDGGIGDVVMMPPADHGVVVPSQRIAPRSAWKLSQARIWFVPNKTGYLDNIKVDDNGTLQMPMVELDDSTAYKFHNMMAFEAIHVGIRKDVTAYVRFTRDLVDSAEDVRLLTRKGILEHDLATDEVVRLFDGLARDTSRLAVGSQLWRVRGAVKYGYRRNRVRLFLYES